MSRTPAFNRKFICLAILCVVATFIPHVSAQQNAPANLTFSQFKLGCRHPADPHRRMHYCNDEAFGVDETFAGGWSEIRREAMRIGITPTASYVGALQTNVTGGTHQVWSYAGLLTVATNVDLNKLARIPGLSAYVGTSWGTGSNLATSLDSTIPTSGLYAPSFYLGEMYLQEKLSKEKLTILAGRLSAANSFASLPVFTNYVTYGINPNPYSLGANDVTFFGPPTGTQWGAQATYAASSAIQVSAGMFNTNINSADGENHGADFTLQEGNKGALTIGEIDYLHNQKVNSAGKPGQIVIGFLHNNNSFPALNNPTNYSGGYRGAYLMGQQMIFRTEDRSTLHGMTAWGSWAHNSKDLISPIPWFWGTGLSCDGFIPSRSNDVISAGFIQMLASKYAVPENTEELVELNYQWTHSQYLTITPHIQYLWKPQNTGSHNGTTILGIQLALTL